MCFCSYRCESGPLVDGSLTTSVTKSDHKPRPSALDWAGVGLDDRRWLVGWDNGFPPEDMEVCGVEELDSVMWPGEFDATDVTVCCRCIGPCCNHRQNQYDNKSEMLSPRGQSGLGLKHLASVCSRRTNSQEEIDGLICLHFTLPTTRHHPMIEDSYCARENEKLNCVALIRMT